jgi:hypothetical protein
MYKKCTLPCLHRVRNGRGPVWLAAVVLGGRVGEVVGDGAERVARHHQLHFVAGGRDQRHRQAAVKLLRPTSVHLNMQKKTLLNL